MNKRETTKQTGQRAEDHVAAVFESRGAKLLVRNFSIHNVGELDLVFTDSTTVYVIEVRARKPSPGYPTPAESVTASKRKKIKNTTRYLINRYDLFNKNIYFLIAQVTLDGRGLVQNVDFIPF